MYNKQQERFRAVADCRLVGVQPDPDEPCRVSRPCDRARFFRLDRLFPGWDVSLYRYL
jgi:hypothetical protein